MRYIKKFNEDRNFDAVSNFESFKKFCNESLIYLLDDNFSIFITHHGYGNYIEFILRKDPFKSFKYDTIKYDFLQFIEELNSKYNIMKNDNYCDIKISGLRKNGNFNVDELLKDIDMDIDILQIIIDIDFPNII